MNPLKGPSGFGRIVNGVMNIIMCAILSIYVLWTVQNLPGTRLCPSSRRSASSCHSSPASASASLWATMFPVWLGGKNLQVRWG